MKKISQYLIKLLNRFKKPPKISTKVAITAFLKKIESELERDGAKGKPRVLTIKSNVETEPFRMKIFWAQDGEHYYTFTDFRTDSRKLSEIKRNEPYRMLRYPARLFFRGKLSFKIVTQYWSTTR